MNNYHYQRGFNTVLKVAGVYTKYSEDMPAWDGYWERDAGDAFVDYKDKQGRVIRATDGGAVGPAPRT